MGAAPARRRHWRRYRTPLVVLAVVVGVVVLRPAAPAPERWTVPLGRRPVALAVAARSGRLLVAEQADQAVSLRDAHTGAILTVGTLGRAPETLAVDEAHGRVFTLDDCIVYLQPGQGCRTGSSAMSILALPSGTVLGTVRLVHGATALAVDARTGRVFVASYDADQVSVFDGGSGRLLHTVDVGGAPLALAVGARGQHVFVSTLNPGGGRSSVRMLDGHTGVLLATARLGRFVGALLSDARAQRVLAASDGDLYLLDARSGRVLRRLKGGGQPLAVDERGGRALIGGQGHLRLISTRDGAPVGPVIERGTVGTLSIQAVGVDDRAGRFYMATDRGVVVLDGHTGRMWRALSLPRAPLDLAVDAATQRVFILPNSTTAVPALPSGVFPLVRWVRRTLPWLPLPAVPPPSARGALIVLDTSRL